MEYLHVVAVVLGLVSVLDNSNGLSTYPVSQDGQTSVLAAEESSTNVVVGINQTMINVIPQLSEFNGVSINATIEIELSPGRYQFIVISSNIYGNSEQSENSSIIMIVPNTSM